MLTSAGVAWCSFWLAALEFYGLLCSHCFAEVLPQAQGSPGKGPAADASELLTCSKDSSELHWCPPPRIEAEILAAKARFIQEAAERNQTPQESGKLLHKRSRLF